jgi:hypothetical protein
MDFAIYDISWILKQNPFQYLVRYFSRPIFNKCPINVLKKVKIWWYELGYGKRC